MLSQGHTLKISIHAPRVGSDLLHRLVARFILIFQSTLPVWGATLGQGGGQVLGGISIHAPRVGSDRKNAQKNIWCF